MKAAAKIGNHTKLEEKFNNGLAVLFLLVAGVLYARDQELLAFFGAVSVVCLMFYWVRIYGKVRFKHTVGIWSHLIGSVGLIFYLYCYFHGRIQMIYLGVFESLALALSAVLAAEFIIWWYRGR